MPVAWSKALNGMLVRFLGKVMLVRFVQHLPMSAGKAKLPPLLMKDRLWQFI